mgnify:CR=1 FL=1
MSAHNRKRGWPSPSLQAEQSSISNPMSNLPLLLALQVLRDYCCRAKLSVKWPTLPSKQLMQQKQAPAPRQMMLHRAPLPAKHLLQQKQAPAPLQVMLRRLPLTPKQQMQQDQAPVPLQVPLQRPSLPLQHLPQQNQAPLQVALQRVALQRPPLPPQPVMP